MNYRIGYAYPSSEIGGPTGCYFVECGDILKRFQGLKDPSLGLQAAIDFAATLNCPPCFWSLDNPAQARFLSADQLSVILGADFKAGYYDGTLAAANGFKQAQGERPAAYQAGYDAGYLSYRAYGARLPLPDVRASYQTQVRGSNYDEYKIYLSCADNGQGGDITRNGAPLKTYDEWLNS